MEDCINTFRVMAEGNGLKLEKEIKAGQTDILGDSDRLSQVFSNLLSNAVKYTKEGGVSVAAHTKSSDKLRVDHLLFDYLFLSFPSGAFQFQAIAWDPC